MNWSFILGMLDRIPATFWGVIVGSLFTLIGVVATNWHAGRRLMIQLDHDRDLKKQERELALRKDIYLDATEAIAEGMNSIMRFADLNLSPEKLTQRFSEKSAAMAKVHIIATENTVQAMVNFTTEFGATILKLSAKRAPLLEQQQQIRTTNEMVESYGRERDKLLESIKQMNIEGSQDDRRFEVLNKSFEFAQRHVMEGIEKIDSLRNDLRKKQLDYMDECMVELQMLRRLLLPVLSSAREELQVPFDQVIYSRIMAASSAKETTQMRSFLQEIAAPKAI